MANEKYLLLFIFVSVKSVLGRDATPCSESGGYCVWWYQKCPFDSESTADSCEDWQKCCKRQKQEQDNGDSGCYIAPDESPPCLPPPFMSYKGVVIGGKIGNGHQFIKFQNGRPMIVEYNSGQRKAPRALGNGPRFSGDFVPCEMKGQRGMFRKAPATMDAEEDDEVEEENDQPMHGNPSRVMTTPNPIPGLGSTKVTTPSSKSGDSWSGFVEGMFGLAENKCKANGGKCRFNYIGFRTCKKLEHQTEDSCNSDWLTCCVKPRAFQMKFWRP